MFAAIASFFSMITTLFTAGERAANALNNVAGVAEGKSEAYRKEQEIIARKRLAALNSDESAPALPAPTAE